MYNKKLVFISACLGMLLFGIVMISLGTMLPLITAKLSLTNIEAGALTSLLPLGILLGSLVFGPIVDSTGYKILLISSSTMVMISLFLLASATSYTIVQASVFLIGFAGGALNGGTNALVSDISEEDRGANLSLLGIWFGVGALGMPLLLGLLLSSFTFEEIITSIALIIVVPIVFLSFVKFCKVL